tara:strand:+ start:855 stop:1097 length:243 start_codon:yes stop_codon:yes gene_type:complete
MLCAQASTKNGQSEKRWRATKREVELETLRRSSEVQAQGALQPGQAEQRRSRGGAEVEQRRSRAAGPRGARSRGGHTVAE